jgi:hypothetical protein
VPRAASTAAKWIATRCSIGKRVGVSITSAGGAKGLILDTRALHARRQGDYRLARRLLEEALALHRALRGPRRIGMTLAALGRVVLAEGDAATARRRLTQGLAVLPDGGQVWGTPPLLRALAQVRAKARTLCDALNLAMVPIEDAPR